MIRELTALFALLVFAFALSAQDADPVKERLLSAKNVFDGEMRAARKETQEWFDGREAAARKLGDKKLVDQIKAERAEFDGYGDLPKSVPTAVKTRQDKALKELEGEYAQAVKDYIKAKKDAEATAVETELKNIRTQLIAVNLLARINLKTHVLGGEWKREDAALVGAAGDQHARLRLPYEPGEEYDLEIQCKRVAGNNCLGVALVAGGRQVVAVLDAWPENGFASGLELIQGKEANDNATTVKGQLLKPDQVYVIVYAVRSGKIEVSIDGKSALVYRGAFDKFSLRQDAKTANTKSLSIFFNPNTSFQIDRISVIPIKGKGTVLK